MLSRNPQQQTQCAFIMGKVRVTPLKPVTIPQLELTAAAVASKMDKMMRAELDLDLKEWLFWTDSTLVLKYIQNEKTRFCTFKVNLMALIRDQSMVSQTKYVNTTTNQADFAS